MNKLLVSAGLVAASLMPLAASAHTDLSIGLGFGLPVYGPPAPVYYAPPPPPVYGYYDNGYGYGPPVGYYGPPRPVYYGPNVVYREGWGHGYSGRGYGYGHDHDHDHGHRGW